MAKTALLILGQSTYLKNILILKMRKKLSQIFEHEKKKEKLLSFGRMMQGIQKQKVILKAVEQKVTIKNIRFIVI